MNIKLHLTDNSNKVRYIFIKLEFSKNLSSTRSLKKYI